MADGDSITSPKLEAQESIENPIESSEVSEAGGDNNETAVEGKINKTKINILLKPVGDAPIMKKKKWAVDPDKRISNIIEFVRKYLHLDHSLSLFLYVNQAFAPSPDQVVCNLYECFGSDEKLVLHYCTTQAWG